MPKRWSKLQKQFYLIRADGLNLQLQCRRYRMDSQWSGTDCPRYWITLDKEIIWDYPKDFVGKKHPERTNLDEYPYASDISDISKLIREYLDTPRSSLMSKRFTNDYWGLINILRAADKRIGKRRLNKLKEETSNIAVKKIIEVRSNIGCN